LNLYAYDREAYALGFERIAGVDEAGRGPLAGPVYAAAVILPRDTEISGLNDSKKLTERKRDALYGLIIEKAAYCIASVDAAGIDEMNILQASLLAMRRAVEGLHIPPDCLLVDGNQDPGVPNLHTRTVVKGDATSAAIAAASILAKVARDRHMKALDQEYPQYLFARHKGYPTKLHYEMLDLHGSSSVHRQSFLRKWRAGSGE